MNKGTALTLAFGVFLVGALMVASGLRNRSLSEVLAGQTSEAQASSAGGSSPGGGSPAPSPVTGQGSNAKFSNVSEATSPASGGSKKLKSFVAQISKQLGWSAQAWENIIEKESGWSTTSENSETGAYGIGQFNPSTEHAHGTRAHPVPGSTYAQYAKAGAASPNAERQLLAMALYIHKRYGNPTAALAFHNAHNWY